MIIRNENEKDYKKIYQLIKKAFETAEHKDGNEQDLAEALRRRTEFPHRILWRSSCAKTRRCLTENLYMQKNSVSDTI